MKIHGWKKKTAIGIVLLLMAVPLIDSFELDALETRRLEEEQEEAAQTMESVPDEIAEKAPEVSAQTAVVIEQKTGRVLYNKKMDEKIYPASTTKIMTALLALERTDIHKKVKVSERALKTEGSAIYLQKGEKVSMEDLLYGLMLRSGNDAALAIAEGVSGNIEDFVELMNKRAVKLGAEHTQFVNPNGLHNENHFTTAHDMALIAREAMKLPQFRKIAGAKEWDAHREAGLMNHFYNKNKVVHQYEGATGIKIGYTKATGRTLVASSERNGMEVICVVMNAPDWFEDSYKLMDFAYDNYEMKVIASGQQPLKAEAAEGGEKDFVLIGPKENITCPIAKGQGESSPEAAQISLKYAMEKECRAPVKRWQKAGELEVYIDGSAVCQAPLYYMEDIESAVQ